MSEPEIVSSTRLIAAPAASIYPLVSSPEGHVRIDGSGMLLASPDSEPVTAVGDTFTMHMDREPLGDIPLGKYDVTVVITNLEPDRWVEWSVEDKRDGGIWGHVYGYRLNPISGTETEVTTYCDWSGLPERRKARANFPVVPLSMMIQSLDKLEALVTA